MWEAWPLRVPGHASDLNTCLWNEWMNEWINSRWICPRDCSFRRCERFMDMNCGLEWLLSPHISIHEHVRLRAAHEVSCGFFQAPWGCLKLRQMRGLWSQMAWGCLPFTSVLKFIQGTLPQPAEMVHKCWGRESRSLGSGLNSTTVYLCNSHGFIPYVSNVCHVLGSVPLETQAVVAVRSGWREVLALSEWPSSPYPQATSGWRRDSLICGRKKLSKGYNLQLG